VAETDDTTVLTLPERFEWFYQREYHRVVSLGYALTGSWWVAEDLAQEAFLAAHGDWDRVSRLERPGGWVRRVVANLAVSAVRRRLAEARALLRLAGQPAPPEPQLSGEAVEFWQAVRSLPRRQAQTIALFYLEGWSASEIATTLGCSEATVRVHLHRGRQALARLLGDTGEDAT
jgi:RNA polymerase sigma-70 factor (ECF subfamily)